MSVSSAESHPSPSNSTHAGGKTISDKLAHKRVLDRKAQQAARSRTKWTIESLQHQVTQLNNALVNTTSRLQCLLEESKGETERVRMENEALKKQIVNSRLGGSNPFLGDMGFAIPNTYWDNHYLRTAGAHLPEAMPSPDTFAATSPGFPGTISATQPTSIPSLSLSLFERVPWNTGPTCVSDRIVQGYVATARMRVHATSDIFLKEQPDINALLTQGRRTESPGVSNVVSDILLSYQEINTLPKKAACLYLMYKLLNWLIFRTKSTYDQMPAWLRPVPLQLQVEHPAWIDRIPWPSSRIYLINNPNITFDAFASGYSSAFNVSWPYNNSHVFISIPSNASSASAPGVVPKSWFPPHDTSDKGEQTTPGDAILNPVFEQHLRQLKNWSVSDAFKHSFPELSAVIESDSCLGHVE